jgi:Secretion system C-terminal sorting domain
MRNEILFNQVKWFRLRILLISAGLISIGNYLSAQVIGDYRSNVTSLAPWDATATWQTWDGSAWVAATAYPGQNLGTGVVTITDGDAISLNVSPTNAIGSLIIQEGINDTQLFIFDGFTLTVTSNAQISAATSGAGIIKQISMNGATAQLNCASLTLLPGADDLTNARLNLNNGGIVNVTGNISMGILTPLRTYITFGSGGVLNVGGNIIGGDIIPGSGIINFNGSGVQNIGGILPLTLYNVGMINAASTLQLNGNVTLNNMLTLTAGKINTQANTLTLANANLITGGSISSYVYSTGAGRLRRNGLTATAYNFPVGTSTNYLPVIVSPTAGTSDFSVNVFSPASTNGVEGGPTFSDKSKIVDAVWNIDRPTGTGDATITIQWEDALEGATFAGFGDGQIGISRNNTGTWLPTIATSANAAANTVTATFNTFSPFGIGQIGEALPVKFGAIKTYEKQNGIQLDWKVYSENKVKSYEIERSADARTFTTVGSLPALYNNTSDGDYGFFDANPLVGTSYYRIKNNDLDGKSSYSIVIRVNRNKTIKGLSLYPNPVVNRIVLLQGSDLGHGNYMINIFGANGQEIYKQQIKHNGGTISQTIELPLTLSKGVYMLSVKDENGNIIFKEKLVKQ